MRVQNEGTGKSSWWMINPDAKPGKAARRRATSMETHKYEKKRGRVKKRVEALRNGLMGMGIDAASPSSSISEGIDVIPASPLHYSFTNLSPDAGFIGSSGIGSGRASSLAGGLNGTGGIISEGGIDLLFSSPMDIRDSGTGSDTNDGQIMDQAPTPPQSGQPQQQSLSHPHQQQHPTLNFHQQQQPPQPPAQQPPLTNGHHPPSTVFTLGPNNLINHQPGQQPGTQHQDQPPQQTQPAQPVIPTNHLSQHNQYPPFNLTTDDFRPRASSNASSCGRLSPLMVKDFLDNIFNDA